MPFGIIGRTGPGLRQVVWFGDRSTGRGTFGVQFGARHCNQWGLYGVRVRQCHDAALLPNYFRQTCYELMIITNCGLSGQRCSRHTLFPLYFSICFCLSRVANLLWTMSAHQWCGLRLWSYYNTGLSPAKMVLVLVLVLRKWSCSWSCSCSSGLGFGSVRVKLSFMVIQICNKKLSYSRDSA